MRSRIRDDDQQYLLALVRALFETVLTNILHLNCSPMEGGAFDLCRGRSVSEYATEILSDYIYSNTT
jgi:hypothetical protein